jgi:spore germination cell wall hydrolase CwlJ-like protein
MTLGTLMFLAALIGGTTQQHACLAATVYLEARDQPLAGQVAVAEVALDRRDAGLWGDSVCEVVKSHRQFAPTLVSRSTRIDDAKAWRRAWQVADATLRTWELPPERRARVVPDADHFYAHNLVRPDWTQRGEQVAVIGDHTFYRIVD